jgi:hypothetical protein
MYQIGDKVLLRIKTHTYGYYFINVEILEIFENGNVALLTEDGRILESHTNSLKK